MLHDYLEAEAATAASIKNLLRKKAMVLRQADPWSAVEEGFFGAMTGDFAARRLQKLVLAALPSKEKHTTTAEALAAINMISDNKLMSFCGAAERAYVTSVKSWVLSISQGRLPRFPTDATKYVSDVKEGLALLCSVEMAGGANEQATRLRGAEAVQHKFSEVKAMVEKSEKITCSSLSPLHGFGWLLDKDQHKVLAAWAKKVMGPEEVGQAAGHGGSRKPAEAKTSKASVATMVKGLWK
jgi:hypothetical protein